MVLFYNKKISGYFTGYAGKLRKQEESVHLITADCSRPLFCQQLCVRQSVNKAKENTPEHMTLAAQFVKWNLGWHFKDHCKHTQRQ